MKVLVTRPQREAQKLVDALCAMGFEAAALPLIGVSGPPDPAAVAQAWQRMAEFDAVMFVSGNAVDQFFALKPSTSSSFTSRCRRKTRAYVTGPGSLSALRRAGVGVDWVDAPDPEAEQFDSEALWQVVEKQVVPGFRLLIVRGAVGDDTPSGVGRDWFAAQVQAAGGQVEYVVAYQRELPQWSPELFALASQAAEEGAVWLFSSSQAISNLAVLCPALTWEQARAVVTHARIGQTAREAGFGLVMESRPSTPALVASIESLQ